MQLTSLGSAAQTRASKVIGKANVAYFARESMRRHWGLHMAVSYQRFVGACGAVTAVGHSTAEIALGNGRRVLDLL